MQTTKRHHIAAGMVITQVFLKQSETIKDNLSVGRNVEKGGPLYTAGGNMY